MAIYHLAVKTVCRGAGRSATAAAAYRSGERIADERTGQVHDYTRRGGVEHTELCTAPDAPSWARSRAELWNAAELKEKRKDARVAREFEAALPAELNQVQRQDLARQFAQALVQRYGIAADLCIHEPHGHGDERNFHVHILCTTRQVGAQGWGAKTRQLDEATKSTAELGQCRALWAELANRALERAGRGERIDHRSLAAQRAQAQEQGDLEQAQSLDRAPTTHLGPAAAAMERKRSPKRHSERGKLCRERVNLNQEVEQLRQELAQFDAEKEQVDRELTALQIPPAPEPEQTTEPTAQPQPLELTEEREAIEEARQEVQERDRLEQAAPEASVPSEPIQRSAAAVLEHQSPTAPEPEPLTEPIAQVQASEPAPEPQQDRAVRQEKSPQAAQRPGRTYLSVPFTEHEQAKAAGARFEWQTKRWYAPQDAELAPLARWLLQEAQEPAEGKELCTAIGFLGTPSTAPSRPILLDHPPASVLPSGDIRYELEDGGIVVDRQDEPRVEVHQVSEQSLNLALEVAVARFGGGPLLAQGSEEFQRQIGALAEARGIELHYTDPALEAARVAAAQEKERPARLEKERPAAPSLPVQEPPEPLQAQQEGLPLPAEASAGPQPDPTEAAKEQRRQGALAAQAEAPHRTYLTATREEKAQISERLVLWDGQAKLWYALPSADLEALEPWLAQPLEEAQKSQAQARREFEEERRAQEAEATRRAEEYQREQEARRAEQARQWEEEARKAQEEAKRAHQEAVVRQRQEEARKEAQEREARLARYRNMTTRELEKHLQDARVQSVQELIGQNPEVSKAAAAVPFRHVLDEARSESNRRQGQLDRATKELEAWRKEHPIWTRMVAWRIGTADDLAELEKQVASANAALCTAQANMEALEATDKAAKERQEAERARVRPAATAEHAKQEAHRAEIAAVLEECRMERARLEPKTAEQLLAEHPSMVELSKSLKEKEGLRSQLARERGEVGLALQKQKLAITAWRAENPKRAWAHEKGWRQSKELAQLEGTAQELEGQFKAGEEAERAAQRSIKEVQAERAELRKELGPWAKEENSKQVRAFQLWRERYEPEQVREERQRERQGERRRSQEKSRGQGRGG